MMTLQRVRFAYQDPDLSRIQYDITCADGRVASIQEHSPRNPGQNDTEHHKIDNLNSGDGLIIPSFCHSHIHLDKCYLLDRCELVTGDFKEALVTTGKAKEAFLHNTEDLYQRGKRLIMESIEAGATSVRAHVEVDSTVKYTCLDTAIRIKEELSALCDIQVAAFAQDPLFSESEDGAPEIGVNWSHLCAAAARPGVEVVGSAPYVERSAQLAKENILMVLDLAYTHNLHADFHLDYNLDSSSEPLIWFLLENLQQRVRDGRWKRNHHVCIGHATRLTLWTDEEWRRFAETVAADDLPVSLVGLPQSDMYMMGRHARSPPRGTLNPVRLEDEHKLKVAMAVNNVGNAFTPQGAPDPLSLCTLGVALFQAGTKQSCQTLLESVTVNARAAIGCRSANLSRLVPQVGDPADFVLLHDNEDLQSAVCNPSYTRTTIKGGRIVARRERRVWFLHSGDRVEGA